jgi:hypothetical protein
MSGISFQFKGRNYIFDNLTREQVICINELIEFYDDHKNTNPPAQAPLGTPTPEQLQRPHQNDKIDLEHSEKSLLWWGYMHSSGDIQVKRYFGTQDITEVKQSPFIHKIVGPFKAFGRADAENYVNEQLKDIV